ncbi:TolC family protein [Flavobacterium silvaticum]|uniref:TolC family protein n=1 Tax=Flavobacterium silvaticum TaxID=1852020 RepID=A0A972G1F4_9FLAO|nr:TolC family protein [Flavobacterium silvaticum]NMH28686.1 TolC family protein [Flavobacterium silvaticum]
MKKLLSILLLSSAIVVSAQEKPLSLKDAIQFALQNKADAKKAKLDVENAGYQIQEARSQALPTISANGSLTYNPILQSSALPGEFFGAPAGTIVLVPFGQKWNSTAGFALSQKIFDLTVFTGLKAAKTTREFYQINANLTDEMIIERVADAYYQVLVAREQYTVNDSNYVKTSRVLDVIKGQFNNGLAKKIDLDRTTVRLSNIGTQRTQSLNTVELQENALKFYMGMPSATPITLAKEEVVVKPLPLEEQADVEQRVQFQVMKKEEQLLQYQKKAEKAGFYPSLSLSANYNYQGLGNEFVWFSKPQNGTYWTDYSSIGLNLHIPIFTGFGTKAKVAKADVALRKHQEDMADTKLSLQKEYSDAMANLKNNLATLTDQTENVRLAQEVTSNNKNNYINGLATLTDLLDSENELIQAQSNYNTALLRYKLAEIQYIKSKGELKTLAQ